MTEQQTRPSLEGLTLTDPEVQECPFDAYDLLRDEAPVHKDPVTEFYIVSRHEDIRTVLLDPITFSSQGKYKTRQQMHPERWARIRKIYADEGWAHVPSLAHLDEPAHKQLRSIWDNAFRPGKINDLEPRIRAIVNSLLDGIIDDGECEFVSQFAVPLPLTVICGLMGAPADDIWRIRGWIDAWINQGSLMISEEEEIVEVRKVIEAQHYFQGIIERLRREPDDSLFSEVVNTEIPEWGRKMTDHELQASMFADLFAAGAETTANALASGVKLLVEHPQAWEAIKADRKNVRTFVEEVLRLESPTQGLTRLTTRDVEMHDVVIPEGSVVHMRFGAANRDERQFECPVDLDVDRKRATTHHAFGGGSHHCVGAPLARRELNVAFSTFADRLDEIRFAPDKNSFNHHRSVTFRGVTELHIEFTPAKA